MILYEVLPNKTLKPLEDEKTYITENLISSVHIKLPSTFGDYPVKELTAELRFYFPEGNYMAYAVDTQQARPEVPITNDITEKPQTLSVMLFFYKGGNVIGKTNSVDKVILDAPLKGEPLTPRAEADEKIREQQEKIAEQANTITEQAGTISSQGEQITELSGEVDALTVENEQQAQTIARQNTTIDQMNRRVPPMETPNPVTPTRNQQVIRPSGDYAGLASVTINPVTADIDSNIVPNNIKNGVVIMGVEGNYGEDLEKFLTTGFGEPFTLELHGDIRAYACYRAKNLEEVSLYDGISIGDNAFRYCPNLKKINVHGSTFALQTYCFANTSSLETLYMPEATNIGVSIERAFILASSSVQNIYCPNVRTIGYHSLEKCSYLISISLPNVVSMERESFSGCSRLKTLYLGNKVSANGITISGENSFKGCSSLEYVTLENGFNGQINLSASTLYSVETIVSWFEALADRTGLSALSFIIGSTNLAKLTAEQKAIAINKNWNLA